jgi:phytoene synthase
VLERAYAHCAHLLTRHARSFALAARFLPAVRRGDVYVLYAFCRTVDDLADGPQAGASPNDALAALQVWRRWLLAGSPADPDDPVKYALAHVRRTHDLPLRPLLDLLDGLCADVVPRHLPDARALDEYCYRVAGTVGLVMAPLLGTRDATALACARDLGIAMQLTNVLRDMGEDLGRGRIYLPAAEMARYGYGRADLERGVIDARFVALMRHYIARARRYYAGGLAGVGLLPGESRVGIALAAHAYAGILSAIEHAAYDVFTQRAHLGRWDKLRLVARLRLGHPLWAAPRRAGALNGTEEWPDLAVDASFAGDTPAAQDPPGRVKTDPGQQRHGDRAECGIVIGMS